MSTRSVNYSPRAAGQTRGFSRTEPLRTACSLGSDVSPLYDLGVTLSGLEDVSSGMQFGIFTVGDVTEDPTTGYTPTEAERIRASS
jgi:hypothetical protein